MSTIYRWAAANRLLVLAVAVGMAAVAVVRLRAAPVDVLPEFAPPYAEVQTEALGLSAEEVEQLITVPLEADLLNGVEGVRVLRSSSLPGLSSIVMVFEPGSDIYRERQLVEERLTQAHALPHVSRPPTLLQPLSSSSRVLMVGLSSNDLSGVEQSVIAHWVMRPKLIGVPGVANVSVWGMRDQQLQVLVDPERLRRQGVTLSQVVESSGNAQVVSPLTFLEASTPGTGGFIESPQQRLQVRHLIEKIADPEALGGVPVAGTGGRLRLSDVADIAVDHQPLIGNAVVQGGPGLMLVVEKFPGADTRAVTEGVEDALEELRPGLTGLRTDTTVFRPSDYLDRILDSLGLALLVGGGLALMVLVACRRHWRSIVVAAVAVPMSLLVAGLALDLLGQGFNAIAIAGLAAAVTVVVDEALVASGSGRVRRPLTYATVIVLLTVLPIAVMGGRPGDFFGPAAVAYVVAVLSAVAVAITVTPALASLLNGRRRSGPGSAPASSRLGDAYLSAFGRFARRRRSALVAAGATVLILAAVVPFLRAGPVPSFRDPDLVVEMQGPPGTSEERMTSLATGFTETLTAIPGVEGVGAHVGRAVTGDRVTNVSSASVWLRIDEDADREDTVATVEAAARAVPGVEQSVMTYTAKRIRDVGALTTGDNLAGAERLDVLTGADRPLAVRVFGQDLTVLRRQAIRVRDLIADVPGLVAPRVQPLEVEPTIEIEVDLDKAQSLGLTPGHVRRAEATLLQGIQVGSVFEEQKVFDVVVRGTAATGSSVADVRAMLIDTPRGGHVRLGQVADVRVVSSPSRIERDSVSRYLDVVAGVDGRSVDAVVADIEDRLAGSAFPLEYHAEVLAESTSDEIGAPGVLGVALAVPVAVLLLLQALFRGWRLAVLVTLTLPLSLSGGLVGGLLVALVDGAGTWLGSALGLLAVFALATRVDLVLVTRLRSLEAQQPDLGRGEVVRQVVRERLAPVGVSAAAVAALAAPFAVLGSRPGLEILWPLSLVVLGGLVSVVLTAMFLLPALYLHLAPGVGQDEEESDERSASPPAGERAGQPAGIPAPRMRPETSQPDREPVS